MLIKALVRAVNENANAEKPVCKVTLEVTHPLEIIELRLFKNSYNDGTVAKFKQVLGAEVDLPLQAEIYNNKVSWNLPFGESFQLPSRPTSVKPAANA